MPAQHMAQRQRAPTVMLVELRSNGVLRSPGLSDRVADLVPATVTVNRIPLVGGRIESDASALDLHAKIAVCGMANQEVDLAIPCPVLLPTENPTNLKESEVVVAKVIAQRSIDFRFSLRREVAQLLLDEVRKGSSSSGSSRIRIWCRFSGTCGVSQSLSSNRMVNCFVLPRATTSTISPVPQALVLDAHPPDEPHCRISVLVRRRLAPVAVEHERSDLHSGVPDGVDAQ